MSKKFLRWLADLFIVFVLALATPAIVLAATNSPKLRRTRRFLDWLGIGFVRHHYHQPLTYPGDLLRPLDEDRPLPGLDLNEKGQLALLAEFSYRDELQTIPLEKTAPDRFGFNNNAYVPGDSETLYNVIRHFKPRRIVEIGSGQSTLISRIALEKNTQEVSDYKCRHICIEPYEAPWLEGIGVEVVRERVECCNRDVFTSLEANDILFIDSSHVIRPQGDVLVEYLELLPSLNKGVLVHVHDIFTPRDYLSDWILSRRRMWNEQYLLEAFLSLNRDYRVMLAVNWLTHHHRDALNQACPILEQQPYREPGAFWICRN